MSGGIEKEEFSAGGKKGRWMLAERRKV